jgi:hypothetical protein
MLNLLVQYNYSGYKWFAINDLSFNDLSLDEDIYFHSQTSESDNEIDNKRFYQISSKTEYSPVIKNLCSWGTYRIIFLKDGQKLILAVRGIEEKKRQTGMAVIFIGDMENYELLHKILLSYLGAPCIFEEWVTSIFEGNPNKLTCHTGVLKHNIQSIAQSDFSVETSDKNIEKINRLNKQLQYADAVYFIASDYSQEKILDELKLDETSLRKAVSFLREQWTEQCDSIKEAIKIASHQKPDGGGLGDTDDNPDTDVLSKKISELETKLSEQKSTMYAYIIGGFVAGLIIGILISKI